MNHRVTRRRFINTGLGGLAAAVLCGCQNPRRWVTLEPYVRPAEQQLPGVATFYATTCRQCPAGCGIVVRIMNGRAVKIEGNPEHPLNRGKLCPRGQAGLQVLYNPDRISGPVTQAERGSRQFRAIGWAEGLQALQRRLSTAGSRVGVWLGSTSPAQLQFFMRTLTTALSAPAPVVYDLFTAFNGSYATSAAAPTASGQPGLPGYLVGDADVVLSFGADFLGPWLSQTRYGVEFGRFRGRPLGTRGYLIQLEPRQSMTGAKADMWLPVRPGTEAMVAQAIIGIIAQQAIGNPTQVSIAKGWVSAVDVGCVADVSGISSDDLLAVAQTFAAARAAVALPGPALAAATDASLALSAVQVLNLIAAASSGQALSVPASPPTSLTPTAVSPYSDVKALLDRMQANEVDVLLVHGANPAYDLPPAANFAQAAQKVPLVVSFSPIVDETAVLADLVLPDRTYLESWGYEVVAPDFGLPTVTSQQPVVTPVFDCRSTADLMLAVAQGLPGVSQALPWQDEVAYLQQVVAALPAGAFDGQGADVLWSRFLQHGGWWPAAATPASAPATVAAPASSSVSCVPLPSSGSYPYLLHLYLSEFMSDGRGANQPWLQSAPDPNTTIAWQTWVELHPDTAAALRVANGDIVRVQSENGSVDLPVYVYAAIRKDTVAIPIGQGHTDYGRYARDRGASPLALVAPDATAAGGLGLAGLRVSLTPLRTHKRLAVFESSIGVTEGFVNQAFPGQ